MPSMVKIKRKLAIPRGAGEGGEGGGGEIVSKTIKVKKKKVELSMRTTTITTTETTPIVAKPQRPQQIRDILEEEEGSSESGIEDAEEESPELTISPEELLRRHFESRFAPLDEDEGEEGKSLKRKRMGGGGGDEDEDQDEDEDSSSDEEYNSDEDKFEGFSDISEQDAAATAAEGEGLGQLWGDVDDDDSDEAEDEGDDDEEGPEVVDYTGSRFTPVNMLSNHKLQTPKSEIKAFMSHKIPTLLPTTAPALAPNNPTSKSKPNGASKTTTSDSDTDPIEALNLKNDLALQRLLLESHLLNPFSTNSSSTLNPTGKNRHRAINTRIQSLGGIDITKHRMPVKMKHGITVANEKREVKRRKVAKDGGIILEKKRVGEEEKRKKKELEDKRRGGGVGAGVERGFGKPSVGKFRNGALVLSKKDVREIEGSGGGTAGGGGRKGGKKGGGKGGKGKKRR